MGCPSLLLYCVCFFAQGYPMVERAVSDLDIELEDGMEDSMYLDILFGSLRDILDEQRPELVVYQVFPDTWATS